MKEKWINKYNLPNLPLPNLEETINKYLKWVKPLLKEDEFIEIEKETKHFLSNSISKDLQDYLLKKTKDKNNSWLVDWWMTYGYLMARGPSSPECSLALPIKFDNEEKYSSAEKIALILYSSANIYKILFLSGQPKLEIGDKKLSTDQIRGAFCAMRIPKDKIDEYFIEDDTLIKDAILLIENQEYLVTLFDENNEVKSLNEIYSIVKSTIENHKKNKSLLDVGMNAITASINRDDSGKFLSELLKEKENKKSFDKVKKSILVVCYEDKNTINDKDWADKAAFDRKFYNRWHGKGVMFIVNEQNCAVACDHTYMDGVTYLRILEKINLYFQEDNSFKYEKIELNNKLDFNLTSSQKLKLKQYMTNYKNYMDNISYEFFDLDFVTRPILKGNGILSADGFAHVAFYLAQKRTWNEYWNTYIAVDMTRFFRGRTECVRPLSEEMINFAISFEKKEPKEKQKELLLLTLNEHYARVKQCQQGFGINRHMFGLEIAAKELNQKIDLFKMKQWKAIEENRMSTSSLPHPMLRAGWFAPVHSNGFGIFYAITNKKAQFSISCWKKDEILRDKFITNLTQIYKELMEIIK